MKEEQQKGEQQGGAGRISNPGLGTEQGLGIGRDISHIDQQEGEMNNGTIGRDWEHQPRQEKNENQ